MDGALTKNEKAKITSNLLMLAPPCQFNEVFTDVRILVNDDELLKDKVTPTFGLYNKEQLIPSKIPDKQYRVLITKHNDMGNGRFLDSRGQQSFKFDHLKRVASDLTPVDLEHKEIEPLRKALEAKFMDYVDQHFRSGYVSVFSKISDGQPVAIICIQSHYNKSFTSGRWRSEWTVPLKKSSDTSEIEVKGVVKIQTHIYEDGNVQLLTSKDFDFKLANSSPDSLAKDVIEKIQKLETTFQEAIGDNLKNMSNTTFKSLRRQLPVTHNKIDWNKITNYRLGGELFRS